MPSSGHSEHAGATAPQASPRVAFLLLFLVILIWGANWPIMKVGLDYIAPLTFSAARLALGALTMFIVLAARGQLAWPSCDDMPVVISVGLLQLAGFLIFINLALTHVDAGRSAILSYTTMVWVTPIAIFFLGETPTKMKIIGVLCGVAGIAVMFHPMGFDWSDRDALIGNAYLLAGSLAWGIGILHVRVHRWHQSPLVLSPWQMLVGLVPTAVLAYVWEADAPIHWSPELIAVLAYNGPIATALGLWAWITVNRTLPAIASSMGSLGVPLAGVVLATLVLGEPVTVHNAAGLLLIGIGIALVGREVAKETGAGRDAAERT